MMQQHMHTLGKRAARPTVELPAANSCSTAKSRSNRSARKIRNNRSSGSGSISNANVRSSSMHENQKADLLRVFDIFDRDGDGKVSTQELKAALRALGVKGINKEKLHVMLLFEGLGDDRRTEAHADTYKSVSFEQFVHLCLPTSCSREAPAEEELREIFTLLDRDSKGSVTAADLLDAARAVKSSLGPADMELIIREVADDEEKGVTFQDFQRVFKRMYDDHGVRLSLVTTAAMPSAVPSATLSAASPRSRASASAVAVRSTAVFPRGVASSSSDYLLGATTAACAFRASTAMPSVSPAPAAAPPEFSAAAGAARRELRQMHSRSTGREKQSRFSVRKQNSEDTRRSEAGDGADVTMPSV